MLNAIDNFIASLWEKNDQLSVYNPQIKTIYDTVSWAYDDMVNPSKKGDVADWLERYKKELFTNLCYPDPLPSFTEAWPQMESFFSTVLSRDVRNSLKWLEGDGGADRGVEKVGGDGKRIYKTYDDVWSYVKKRRGPLLGQRDPDGNDPNDRDGFVNVPFVEIVQEDFRVGNYRSKNPIFTKDFRDDFKYQNLTYLWFMYGILPRNNITFDSLRQGLTSRTITENNIKDTIKFLGLVFNLHTTKQVDITVIEDGKKVVKTYYLIDVYREIPHPVNHSKLHVDEHRELHQFQETAKPGQQQAGQQGKISTISADEKEKSVTLLSGKYKELSDIKIGKFRDLKELKPDELNKKIASLTDQQKQKVRTLIKEIKDLQEKTKANPVTSNTPAAATAQVTDDAKKSSPAAQ